MSADEATYIIVDGESLEATIVEDVLNITVTEVIDFGTGTSHTGLTDRDLADQHPIGAITGLSDVVDDVVLNNAHRVSDGKDHADVVLNNAHRVSDGKDHADVVLNNAHRVSGGHPADVITGLKYKLSFSNVDLVAGVLTVTHNLNTDFPSAVTVWDNLKFIISPDDVQSTGVNTLTVDLSSYGVLTGTWNVSVII